MGRRSVPAGAPVMVMGLWGEEVRVPDRHGRVIWTWQEQEEHRRELARTREHKRWAAGNPMIKMVGSGPEFRTCASCVYLMGRRYKKCQLRGTPTHGTGTDHRSGWPACARYIAREG